MAIPISYTLRNLATRRMTTVLTAGGMALVVFVYVAVLMLDEGLRRTLVQTGSDDNVVIIRRGSETEIQSGVYRDQAGVIEMAPQIRRGANGEPIVSKETVVLINLNKRGSDKPSNIIIRGVGQTGLEMRPQVKIVEGRMFRPGASEVIAGRAIATRFTGAGIGETLRFGSRDWSVVGTFDAGGTGFDSEIWGDVDQLMQAFRRPVYSSMVVKLNSTGDLDRFRAQLESDPRLTVQAKPETVFYAEQSEQLSKFISYLGISLSVIFSIGAMIGAMITMYASVANRVTEIGTLRALGFKRRSILFAFLTEALLISVVGWALGLLFASFMQLVSFSTTNFQSFSELAFSFTLNGQIVVKALVFALIMGVLGGFLPAVRAARMKIVDSLRAA